MSRLYYDAPANQAEMYSGKTEDKTEQYIEKVIKLIPSEVIAVYLTICGIIPSLKSESLQGTLYWVALIVGIVGTPIYLNRMAKENEPKLAHIIVSTVLFVIWAYQITGNKLLGEENFEPALASILLVIITFFSGKIPLN